METDYIIQLIRQRPINYNGLLILPISFEEICEEIGLKNFDSMMIPFQLTKECIKIEEEFIDDFDIFKHVILVEENLLYFFCYIIQKFTDCGDITKKGESILLYKSKREANTDEPAMFEINSDNFDDICEIILKITGKEKIKVEKEPKNMSERQRDVWEKLQAGRKKEAQKNEVHIYDVLNVCEFGGNYHIPIEEIEKWTLWKIMNCYKARINIKTYDDSLKICLVSGDGKSISDENHWHNKLMIRD